MSTLQPNEYDASYFDGSKQTYKHNAGYGKYERWYRKQGVNSLGEHWKDKAKQLFDTYNLSGLKVLEIGCAKGFIVEDLRDMGVDCYGLDVSSYAIGEATPEVTPYLTIGDVKTYLSNYTNNEFDIVFSLRTLECFTDVEITDLIKDMNRISQKQFHIIDEFIGYSGKTDAMQYYNSKSLKDWTALGFSKNTILTSQEDSQKTLTK